MIIPRATLKSDEPVMLDGMRFEELQKQFEVPVYAMDFSLFAEAIETGFASQLQAFDAAALFADRVAPIVQR